MWHILNYVPGPGVRRSALPSLIENFNQTVKRPLELFAPTFISLKTEEGKVKKTEKPLLFHYIFVKGEENELKQLCMTREGFSFVMDRTSAGRHLTVSDSVMKEFMVIARYYGNKLPCYPLEGVNLEEGDRVQIASGPFAGLTGTYISRKGGKSGNILVAIDGSMAAVVYDVKADYVRVLDFSRDSRRAYDQLDAFVPRALAMTDGSSGDIDLISAASIFVRRMGLVKMDNPKLEAKLVALLYAAYKFLGDKEKAEESLKKFRELEPRVTNPWTRALCLILTGSKAEAKQVLQAMESKGKPSRLQGEIAKMLNK